MSFLEYFRKIHTHPVNISLHYLAAVLFVLGFFLLLFHRTAAVILFILTVVCLVVGHWIEGSISAVFRKLK
jgi:uncharacterized membrane protein YphA (DoxX/SURF4 family)